MTRFQKLLLFGFAALLVGTIGFIWERSRVVQDESAISRIIQQMSMVTADLKSLRARDDALRKGLVATATRPIAKSSEVQDSDPGMGSPEQLARQAIRDRNKLYLSFLPLYRKLKLAPAQADHLTALTADFMTRRADIVIEAQKRGLSRGNAEIEAMIADNRDKLYADVTSALGPDGFSQWQQFRQSAPVYNLEASLASNLYYTDEPLTENQQAQLTPLLAQLSKNYGKPDGSYLLDAIDPALIVARAGTVLSESQSKALATIVAGQRSNQELTNLAVEWQKAHPPSPAAP